MSNKSVYQYMQAITEALAINLATSILATLAPNLSLASVA
jgi:hypothetical protein